MCTCVHISVSVCVCVCVCVWSALLGLAWLEPSPLACFPSPPPSFSASVDSGRDGQPWFRISWLGRSGVSKREQLYPEVDAEGSGLAVLLGAQGHLG